MNVFFYGLFMDEELLARKGIEPAAIRLGFVDGFGLRIGQRATLIPDPGGRAYGAVMDISRGDVSDLYSEESVADYRPEPVIVETADGAKLEAICYNLPADKLTGSNSQYAASLLNLAVRLGFPESYLNSIRKAGR